MTHTAEGWLPETLSLPVTVGHSQGYLVPPSSQWIIIGRRHQIPATKTQAQVCTPHTCERISFSEIRGLTNDDQKEHLSVIVLYSRFVVFFYKKERERETEKHRCEREITDRLPLAKGPDRGSNPQPRHVP